MPAWWRGKSKSKSSSSCASPRKKEEAQAPNQNFFIGKGNRREERGNKKINNNSFDETLILTSPRNHGGLSPRSGPPRAVGHPLPRPLSSPLPTIPHADVAGATSASVSGSSISSSGSDEAPGLGFFRYPVAINRQMERNEERQFQLHSSEPSTSGVTTITSTTGQGQGRKSMEGMLGQRISPVHPKSLFVWSEESNSSKLSPHPLPLPPSSPPAGGSCSRSLLLSQWKKGKLLGRGTFGHVYLGFNSESGQMCAIKEVNVISDDANSKECLRQLNQEITLLSHLSHPNIVQYYGSELVDDTLSVYLEYVSGGSIYKLLQEYGPFKEPVIRNYTAQILSGLAYLHGRNTVHRDIKGANILVDPNGDIKLADFGMAKHISSYTSIRSFKGSPYWMAPEIIMNGSGYNLSVDIWSLGCTILEMATSKPPWSQYEGVAAIFKIGNSKDIPEIPEHFSPEGKNFLRLCLQRDPAVRPTAVQLMDHPFVKDQASILRASPKSVVSSRITHKMSVLDLSSNRRSASPLRDKEFGTGNLNIYPSGTHSTYKNSSDSTLNTRMNLSLPVSPCSSPLRQFKQSNNRSCLPSPPHPAFSAGAINYSPINNTLYPMRQTCGTLTDPWLEPTQLRVSTPYGSPRRLL